MLTRGIGVVAPPETRLRLSDVPVLQLRASCDCYAYIFALGPDGVTTELLPNQRCPHADNRLRAAVLRSVPAPGDGFSFEFTPPAGMNTVYVLATLRPWAGWNGLLGSPETRAGRTRGMYARLAAFLRQEATVCGLATFVYKFRTCA